MTKYKQSGVMGIAFLILCWPFLAQADACAVQVLRQLGWQHRPNVMVHDLQAASVCQTANLQAAQNQALLQIDLAVLQHDERALQDALYSQKSRCAFQFKVSDAVQAATRKLSLNPDYRFTALQGGWVHFSHEAGQKWQQTQSFGRRFEPKFANSDAIEVFYTGRMRTECGTGRQVAQLALLRELFGKEGFNHAFSAQELSIGTFVSLHDTDSVLQGKNQGELFADGLGIKTAAMGRQAWLGMPGMVVHVKEASFLDDINNQAENFVVVAISAAAQQQLLQEQAFLAFNRDNETVWRLSQQITMVGQRYFERLLIEQDARLWQALPLEQRVIAMQMLFLLQQPMYQDFLIYVHPLGVRSVGFHIARLLDRNPRTPYRVELALSNVSTEIYSRWVNEQLRQCRHPH